MKGLVILLVVVLSSYKTSAQYFESHNLYATGGLVVGNYLGLAGSLNYISHEKYSIQLCYSSFVHEAKFLPSDYDPAFFYARLGLSQPRDQFNSIEVLVGRVIVINCTIQNPIRSEVGQLTLVVKDVCCSLYNIRIVNRKENRLIRIIPLSSNRHDS